MSSSAEANTSRILALFDDYFASLRATLTLDSPGEGVAEAWFLGPKAENADVLEGLIVQAIRSHADFRRQYQPNDPDFITAEVRNSAAYQQAIQNLRNYANDLYTLLQRSVPLSSMRYQAHMLWDQALPAIVGYFGAMLYNQNNVAAEASPLTTELEIVVGNELCGMLGYPVPKGDPPFPGIVPWGHITCDGSVANIEALWAARNVKFFPAALRAALRDAPALRQASGLEVQLLDRSRARLIDLDTWVLLNLEIDSVVRLQNDIADQFGVSVDDSTLALRPYAVQNIGLLDFYQKFMQGVTGAPVAIVPASRHYSWPKAATLLGMGQNNVLRVELDCRARMRTDDLVRLLRTCVENRTPVLAVVAVIGSTEESAVDPLDSILQIRRDFRKLGLDFAVHCDAAWGGYFNSMLRSDSEAGLLDAIPTWPMSGYVIRQYNCLREADSITVDPHKAGYVPYPAGGLCYRNSGLRDLVSLKAPIIFQNKLERTVGIYGIEGSKPGAAAASVYLAHKVIRLAQSGYGKILGRCMWTSKRMYARLVSMLDPRFTITFLQQLPTELAGEGPQAIENQKAYIRANFVNGTNEQIERVLDDPVAKLLFSEMGSDQVILSYAFNFVDKTRTINKDLDKANRLNEAVYNICSMSTPPTSMADLNRLKLIVTSSSFDPAIYGQPFVDLFAHRMGLESSAGKAISFLISTTMDPWTTDTLPTREQPDGDFLAVIEGALADAVRQALGTLGYGA
jgi:glutamate/tyrosine decarboxylase-like PLP-dependent enzyme